MTVKSLFVDYVSTKTSFEDGFSWLKPLEMLVIYIIYIYSLFRFQNLRSFKLSHFSHPSRNHRTHQCEASNLQDRGQRGPAAWKKSVQVRPGGPTKGGSELVCFQKKIKHGYGYASLSNSQTMRVTLDWEFITHGFSVCVCWFAWFADISTIVTW